MKEKRARVLVVSDFYPPHWTGLAKSIAHMCELVQDECEITVATTGAKKSMTLERSIRVWRLPKLFTISRAHLSPALMLFALRSIHKHDIILLNSPSAHILPIAIYARALRKRLIIFHQGDLILPSGLFNQIIQAVFDITTYLSFSLSSAIATYSLDYATHSRVLKPHLHKTRGLMLPVPPPAKISKKISNRSPSWYRDLRKKQSSGEVIVGFAGRMVSEKGFDTLAKAIIILARRKKGLQKMHFIYAGAQMKYEPYFQTIEPLFDEIKQHITFTGLLDENDLGYFYDLIDFFILPSRSECFGLVQAEAALAGAPIIVSDIPGARVLVRDTKYGALFPCGDEKALADAILQMQRIHKTYDNSTVKKLLKPPLVKKNILHFLLGK